MSDWVFATQRRRRWYGVHLASLLGIFVLVLGVLAAILLAEGMKVLRTAAGWSGEPGLYEVSYCALENPGSRRLDYDCRGDFRPDDPAAQVRPGVLLDDGTGGDPTCGDPTGGDPTGGDPTGGDPAGGDPAGGDPAGGDPAGGDPAGGDPAGGDPAGGDPAGGDPAGGPARSPSFRAVAWSVVAGVSVVSAVVVLAFALQ